LFTEENFYFKKYNLEKRTAPQYNCLLSNTGGQHITFKTKIECYDGNYCRSYREATQLKTTLQTCWVLENCLQN